MSRKLDIAQHHQRLRDAANHHSADTHALRVQIAQRDAEILQLKTKLDRAQGNLFAWRSAGEALARLVTLGLASGKI